MNAVLTHRFRRLESKVSFSQGPALTPDSFAERHIGPQEADLQDMLKLIGCSSLEDLIEQTVPEPIRLRRPLQLPGPLSEYQALQHLRALAARNQVAKSYLGLGYHPCIVPPVIQRAILENPGWYTAYTPYQAEIAQGRLEALLNFQTLVADLTGLELANASLLDEATAAAEAMSLAFAVRPRPEARAFFVARDCHPQTLAVVQTRAAARGLQVVVGDPRACPFGPGLFGYLLQYPASDGAVHDYGPFVARARAAGGLVVMAADLLSLTLLVPPGELGADVCVGSSQRLGVPVGFGGPHAAFFATRGAFRRQVPGRLVGVSQDAAGRVGYRLALQTREQHIRRDKATSNICTAQVLPAILASMYAVYHGPQRLRAIARRIHGQADGLAAALAGLGLRVAEGPRFDTVRVYLEGGYEPAVERARQQGLNFRLYPQERSLGIALDETTSEQDLADLIEVLRPEASPHAAALAATLEGAPDSLPEALRRRSLFLTHPVFNSHHTETELLRYIKALEAKDLSLTHSMIPLGSCTMKLNAAAELYPLSWPEFNQVHPFAPAEQWRGYARLIQQLEAWLAELTGFAAVSLQPNAGSQGEYAGLLAIRAYHQARGQPQRTVCLIPTSAHGTNPASAALAGLQVVGVGCDAQGNIDRADLAAKAERHAERLAALMVTYPSTHGVFEEAILELCALVHRHGGQVYMDGANFNAAVGLWRPGDIGADVCHLNLHKTFAMPHGGGGGGMGPIGVKAHLAPYLPGHPLQAAGPSGPVSAAPYGSASLLPITWMYIALMGPAGLTRATQVAIANANYLAARLAPFYPVLYKGRQGRVAHECILDLRPFKRSAGIEVEDVAKRLIDYGFHAPTVSFPVAGTLMLEPTESESKAELDRFCEAMIAIHGEIRAIETGEADRQDNALKHAPHPAEDLLADAWARAYTREAAAYPLGWVRQRKYWPPVGRIDSLYGDRNLFCTCAPVEQFEPAAEENIKDATSGKMPQMRQGAECQAPSNA